jgi:hypothetical protein
MEDAPRGYRSARETSSAGNRVDLPIELLAAGFR